MFFVVIFWGQGGAEGVVTGLQYHEC